MKKLLISISILIALLVSVDFVLGGLLDFLNDKALENNPSGMVLEYTFKKVEAEIVIIGSSRASHHYVSSMIQDSLGETVYNCGNDGSFFLYQTCMIDAILRRYKPKMIVWDLEPSLLSDKTPNRRLEEIDRLSRLFPLFGSNPYLDSILFKRSDNEKIKLMSSMYRYNSSVLETLYKAFLPYHTYDRGYEPLANKGYKFPQIVDLIYESPLNSSYVELFEKTVAKCVNNKVDLVFSYSPRLVRSNYNETESHRAIKEIAEANDILLIDHYHYADLMNDSTMFKDGAHLNDKGAKAFTKQIIKYLR